MNDSAADELEQAVSEARAHRRDVDAVEGQLHVPNHIPRGELIAHVLCSLPVLVYAICGFVRDDIYIAGKRGPGMHLHGVPMWLMGAGMLSVGISLMSVVADHYDTRANEVSYRKFAALTQLFGWALFFVAIALDVWVYRSSTR